MRFISVISAQNGEKCGIFLSSNPRKTSREWTFLSRGVIFLSDDENVSVSAMFGRIRRIKAPGACLSDINSPLFSVIPALLLSQPRLFPLCNGQKRTETRRNTHLSLLRNILTFSSLSAQTRLKPGGNGNVRKVRNGVKRVRISVQNRDYSHPECQKPMGIYRGFANRRSPPVLNSGTETGDVLISGLNPEHEAGALFAA